MVVWDNGLYADKNHLFFNSSFEALIPELEKINRSSVLDGEVVVEDKNEKASFQVLQNYIKTPKR